MKLLARIMYICVMVWKDYWIIMFEIWDIKTTKKLPRTKLIHVKFDNTNPHLRINILKIYLKNTYNICLALHADRSHQNIIKINMKRVHVNISLYFYFIINMSNHWPVRSRNAAGFWVASLNYDRRDFSLRSINQ